MSGPDIRSEQTPTAPRPDLFIYLAIVAVTWLIYGRALSHGFLSNWDDPRYVLYNDAIAGFTLAHLKTIFTTYYVGNYAPVQMLSYMLDHALWGLKAHGFIITNITLHAANGILLYRFLGRFGFSRLSALFGTLVFVAHPVQVESVAWISQRKNLLALFFFLCSFHLYCSWKSSPGRPAMARYVLSLLTFVLSLLTKSVAVILPLGLLLHDRVYHGEERPRRQIVDKLPYMVAALLVSAVALVSQTAEDGGGRVPYHGGSPWTTALTMLPVLLRYLRLLIWPTSLSALYDPPIKTAIDGEVLLGMAFAVALIGAALWLWRRKSRSLFWFGLVVLGLLPVMQIVPIITLMNDRYLYFPMVGVAGLCATLAQRAAAGRSLPATRLVAVVLGGVVLASGALAWGRVPVWKNSLSLWSDTVAKSPGSYTVWASLGEAYHLDGRLDEAQHAYLKALFLNPANTGLVNNLGVLSLDRGDTAGARQFLEPLLRDHPDNLDALLNLGVCAFMDNDLEQARRYFAMAHERQATAVKPLMYLGGVALAEGDRGRANDYFARAASAGLEPRDSAFYKARVMALINKRAEAIGYLQEAVRLGYKDFASLAWDRNFDSIRDSAEYRRLIPAGASTR